MEVLIDKVYTFKLCEIEALRLVKALDQLRVKEVRHLIDLQDKHAHLIEDIIEAIENN